MGRALGGRLLALTQQQAAHVLWARGDLAAAVAHGQPLARGATADPGPVINAGRSVLYASAGTDFAQAARAATQALRDAINDLRHEP